MLQKLPRVVQLSSPGPGVITLGQGDSMTARRERGWLGSALVGFYMKGTLEGELFRIPRN